MIRTVKPINKAALAIIVGGGKGLRMNSSTPKQFLQLKNRPIIAYALEAFGACDKINEIYLVVSKGEVEFCRETLLPSLELAKPIQLVEGGLRRQDSVYNGLLAMEGHEHQPPGIERGHEGRQQQHPEGKWCHARTWCILSWANEIVH